MNDINQLRDQIKKIKHQISLAQKQNDQLSFVILLDILKKYKQRYWTLKNYKQHEQAILQSIIDLQSDDTIDTTFDINKKLSSRLKSEAQFVSQSGKWGTIVSPFVESSQKTDVGDFFKVRDFETHKILPADY